MWFFNPAEWVRHHLFKDASIWEIPLVKPRFGCALDLSLAVRGYDMGLALRKTLEHFKGTPTDVLRRKPSVNKYSCLFSWCVHLCLVLLVRFRPAGVLGGARGQGWLEPSARMRRVLRENNNAGATRDNRYRSGALPPARTSL